MLAEALRLLRIFHDKKQKELANELNISVSYLSEIENDRKKPSLDLIEKYAEIFNTKPSAILFFSENINENEIKSSIRNKIIKFFQIIEKKATDE